MRRSRPSVRSRPPRAAARVRSPRSIGLGSRALGITSAAPGPRRPNLLLDGRRHPIGQVGRAVVRQALEIGPDQGFLGRWASAALAVIDLLGQHEDEFAVSPAVPKTIW